MSALLLLAVLAAEPTKGDANGAARSAAEMAEKMNRAQREAEAVCKPLEDQPLPLEKEREIGKVLAESLRKQHGAKVATPLTEYVQNVGDKVAILAQRQELTWTFEVLENPLPKSGHAPGGTVLVTTGLLARLKNEAQLAAVLGHEVAHLDLDLPARLSRANAQLCRTKRTMAAVYKNDLPGGVEGIDQAMGLAVEAQNFALALALGPTEEEEHAADSAALSLIGRAGYSPAEFTRMLAATPWQSMFGSELPSSSARAQRLSKLPLAKGGKSPSFPKKLKWPKP